MPEGLSGRLDDNNRAVWG